MQMRTPIPIPLPTRDAAPVRHDLATTRRPEEACRRRSLAAAAVSGSPLSRCRLARDDLWLQPSSPTRPRRPLPPRLLAAHSPPRAAGRQLLPPSDTQAGRPPTLESENGT